MSDNMNDADRAELEAFRANEANKKDAPAPVTNPFSTEPETDTVSTGRSVAPTETVTQERPKESEKKEIVPQSYVWLANGEVLRVKNEDLPGAAGAANAYGHWQKDGKVHTIVGVYDVEEEAGE